MLRTGRSGCRSFQTHATVTFSLYRVNHSCSHPWDKPVYPTMNSWYQQVGRLCMALPIMYLVCGCSFSTWFCQLIKIHPTDLFYSILYYINKPGSLFSDLVHQIKFDSISTCAITKRICIVQPTYFVSQTGMCMFEEHICLSAHISKIVCTLLYLIAFFFFSFFHCNKVTQLQHVLFLTSLSSVTSSD